MAVPRGGRWADRVAGGIGLPRVCGHLFGENTGGSLYTVQGDTIALPSSSSELPGG